MLDTERAKLIDAHLKKSTRGAEEIDMSPMWIPYNGSLNRHSVEKIPTKYLIHNIRNGRFRSELLEKESNLKRKLDATDQQDQVMIRKLLLEQNVAETEALKEDITKNGQIEPGIITHDGAVINANRRMAIFFLLWEETRDTKYEYLFVGRLPPGINETDLWRIEAGLQFGRDYRLEYGGVNELLKLKEGEKQGLSDKDISVALAGRFSGKQVREKLDILKLIDNYLKFINKSGEYNLIVEERSLEKFNSLWGVIKTLKNKHGVKGADITEITIVAFGLIEKTDVSHWDIRYLRKIATTPKAAQQLKTTLNEEPEYESDDDEKDVSADETNQSIVKEPEAEQLKEAFVSAVEVVEAQEDKGKPVRLLSKAKSAIEGIDENASMLKSDKARRLLEDIEKRIESLMIASKD